MNFIESTFFLMTGQQAEESMCRRGVRRLIRPVGSVSVLWVDVGARRAAGLDTVR